MENMKSFKQGLGSSTFDSTFIIVRIGYALYFALYLDEHAAVIAAGL